VVNWEAIRAVGEILGPIAVIATLFYLSLQKAEDVLLGSSPRSLLS
jgi:hypothetical protein